MKKNNLVTTIVLSLVFVCLIVSTAASQDASKTVWDLKYYNSVAKSSDYGRDILTFIESVKQATGGRVIITPYWSSSLMSAQESMTGLKNGVFDIGDFMVPWFPGQFPATEVASLPFLFNSTAEAHKAVKRLFDKGLMPEFNTIKMAGFRLTDPQVMAFAKKEVKTLEDLKGMKIRVSPGIASETITALGATPVGIPAADLYMSLDRGVVDGIISSAGFMGAFKINEVAKYLLDEPLWYGINFTALNLKTWNSFPDDIKAIMEKEFLKYLDSWYKQENDDGTKRKNEMKSKGMKFITLSPAELARWKQATKPVEDKFIQNLNAAKMPGQKIVDEAKASAAGK